MTAVYGADCGLVMVNGVMVNGSTGGQPGQGSGLAMMHRLDCKRLGRNLGVALRLAREYEHVL